MGVGVGWGGWREKWGWGVDKYKIHISHASVCVTLTFASATSVAVSVASNKQCAPPGWRAHFAHFFNIASLPLRKIHNVLGTPHTQKMSLFNKRLFGCRNKREKEVTAMGGNKPHRFSSQIYFTESWLRRETKECVSAERAADRTALDR